MRLNVIFVVTEVVLCLGLAGFAMANYASEVMADHPLAYYRFEDPCSGNGYTCADSGNNVYKNGTYIASPSWPEVSLVSGIPGVPSGKAVRFVGSGSSGVGNCIDIYDNNALVTQNMTIECWVKTTSDANNYDRLLQHNGDYTVLTAYRIATYNDGNGGMRLSVDGGGSTWYTGAPSINDGNWHLIDVTYQQIDSNLYEYIYIDGTGIWGNLLTDTNLTSSYERLTLGSEGNAWYMYNGLDGALDEVAIYDKVLDANRIATHYILGNTAPAGTLQFKSATYTVAEDGGSVRIYVSRTDGSSGSASVNYATANGTATAGSDYTAASGTLHWSDGDANDKYFNVSIIDDNIAESNETFDVNLSDANGASLGSPSQTIVTINDNDLPTISGRVREPNDANISGATMTGWPGSAPVTDGNGHYSATVPHGWSGTIMPSKSSYTFGSRSYTNVTTDQNNQDYTSISWIFGTYQSLKNSSITIPDSNGISVTFKLTGGGWGYIANNDSNFGQINLQETNEIKSIFTITTPPKQDTNVGDINVAGALKSITAKTTNLQGNIILSGSLGTLILNDVADNHTITIGPSANPKAGTTAGFDLVSDLVINSQTPIKTITATDWTGGEVNAPSLGSITIKGDKKRTIAGDLDVNVVLTGSINNVTVAGTLSGRWSCVAIKSITGANIVEANLVLSQPPAAKISALGKLTTKGWIDSSQIQSRGSIGTVTAGGIYNSVCFAGVTDTNDLNMDGVLDLPNPATDFNDVNNLPIINKISINGIKGVDTNSVINSNIAAPQILSAYLAYPKIDNSDVNFGISSDYIKATIKDSNGIHKGKTLDGPSDSFKWDDFNIRLN